MHACTDWERCYRKKSVIKKRSSRTQAEPSPTTSKSTRSGSSKHSLWYGPATYTDGTCGTNHSRSEPTVCNMVVQWVLQKATTGRLMRWALNLQEREFDIEHRKGSAHGNADALSRCPMRSCCPYGEKPVEQIHGVAPPLHASAAYFKSDAEAWTAAEFAKLQQADPWCKPIMEKVRKGTLTKGNGGDLHILHEDDTLWIKAHQGSRKATHRDMLMNPNVVVVPESL